MIIRWYMPSVSAISGRFPSKYHLSLFVKTIACNVVIIIATAASDLVSAAINIIQ